MPDREKVIKGLEGMIDYFFDIYRNDTDSYKCAKAQEYSDCAIDAIALLKEKEAIEPDVDSEGTCTCGNCGENVGWYPVGSKEPVRLCKFCSECGQEVKWE